ncbi:hypothetical protein [Smaragdicoccus niigatensis]|uniref:hypothetical protein n=1 Tax=Smaragdicoccus niigatensis TaxID=359359 RepID=UPI00036647B0|nr:hypothetical protein [Smaragdicoccus niigatensis]
MGSLRVVAAAAVFAVAAGCSASETGTAHPSESPTTTRTLPASVQEIVLRPIDENGKVQPGWSVNDAASAVSCDAAKSSPNAVTAGVVEGCGSDADGFLACWPTSHKYSAVCLRQPVGKHLVRIDTKITAKGVAAKNPEPLAIGLDDGRVCSIIHGGAWGPEGAPDFLCHAYPDFAGVWNGINKTATGWTVDVKTQDGQTSRAVTSVYYVGIA